MQLNNINKDILRVIKNTKIKTVILNNITIQ